MKFRCDWSALREAVEFTAHVVPPQSSYLSITADAGALTIRGGTPALQVTVVVLATVDEAGARAVALRPWVELVKLEEAAELRGSLEGRAQDLVVRLRGDRTTLRTFDPDLLAFAPPMASAPLASLDRPQLQRVIRDVLFINDPVAYGAIELRVTDSRLRLASASRTRAAWSEVPLVEATRGAGTVLVPRQTFEQVARAPVGEDPARVTIEPDRAVEFRLGAVTIRSGLLATEFPPVGPLEKWEGRTSAAIDRAALLEEVQFAQVFAEGDAVQLQFGPQGLRVNARSGSIGDHRGVVAAEVSGLPQQAVFTCGHLLEVLRALDDETLELSLSEPLRPAIIRVPSRPGFGHVLGVMNVSV